MIQIREATESDVGSIRDIFIAAYSGHYAHGEFCEIGYLKKLVFDDDALLLVAEDDDTGRVLGTGSIILDIGAYGDLTGEFGRLVVHPDARRQGIGKLLMEGRLERVKERLHMALVENRAMHPFSQRISAAYGFVPVGFLPSKMKFAEREDIALYARAFGSCLKLRKNHPHIIPEAHPIASRVLRDFGIDDDAIIDESTPAYASGRSFELEAMTSAGYTSLLHLERGRVRRREILGPVKLHAGIFQLRVSRYQYLLARDDGRLAGGVGFHVEAQEEAARILELVSSNDEPVRPLLEAAVRHCFEIDGAKYIEVDVNAHATAMQRTLLELGFLPAAYVPAMSFHRVERLDAIRMIRLAEPLGAREIDLFEATEPIADLVLEAFRERDVDPHIAEAIPRAALFEGLSEEQVQRVASICHLEQFPDGARLAERGVCDGRAFLLLSGAAEVSVDDHCKPVGIIEVNETAGELSLLRNDHPHAATILATADTEAAVLEHEELAALLRRRPDIGVVFYGNLAAQLGSKLLRADQDLLAEKGQSK